MGFFFVLPFFSFLFLETALCLLCRILDGIIIACQCGEGSKLGCSTPHRHLRMFLGNMMRQIDYIVVIHIYYFQIYYLLSICLFGDLPVRMQIVNCKSSNCKLLVVSSYLSVTFLGCGTFLEVQAA